MMNVIVSVWSVGVFGVWFDVLNVAELWDEVIS
jgi:hypothetical protein